MLAAQARKNQWAGLQYTTTHCRLTLLQESVTLTPLCYGSSAFAYGSGMLRAEKTSQSYLHLLVSSYITNDMQTWKALPGPFWQHVGADEIQVQD